MAITFLQSIGAGIQGVWLACVLTDLLVLLVAAAMTMTSVKNMGQKIRAS